MWERVARDAADDAGTGDGAARWHAPREHRRRLLAVVAVRRRRWPGWPSAWARRPARRRYSGIGGSVPHVLRHRGGTGDQGGRPRPRADHRRGGTGHRPPPQEGGRAAAVVVQAGREAALPDGHGLRPLRDQPRRLRGLPHLRALRQRPPGAPRARARRAPRRAGPGHGADDRGRRARARTPGSPWRAAPTRS